MYKNFREYLITIHQEKVEHQKELLNDNIEKWKGNLEQIDDIVVMGVRIS